MKKQESNEELYILPFDHRSSFYSKLFGFSRPLNRKQLKIVRDYKMIVFQGFLKVYKKFEHKDWLGILVDEEFGPDILKQSRKLGVNVSVSTEKSGQKVLMFEYGVDFKKHLEKVKPLYAKVLVRYNPSNRKDNIVQQKRLKELSDFCKKSGVKMLIEPLVPPTDLQLKKFGGDQVKYDLEMRPKLMVKMINELYKAGVNPSIWKVEAVDKKADWKNIIKAVKVGGRGDSKIIVLGRGANKKKVNEWLTTASQFKDIVGFAVGRTVFFKSLLDYKNGKITKEKSINIIAKNFEQLIKIWSKNRK